jgi:uncharacterized protein with GYD domain
MSGSHHALLSDATITARFALLTEVAVMATFILLTRAAQHSDAAADHPASCFHEIMEAIRSNCVGVEWVQRYAILGPVDFLDVFTAPSIETAMQVSAIVRRHAHVTTEVWSASPWCDYVKAADHPLAMPRPLRQSDYLSSTSIGIVCE